MATAVLTPANKWQIDFGSVASKNPEAVVLTGAPSWEYPMDDVTAKRAAMFEYQIPAGAAYEHGVATSLRVYCYANRTSNYKVFMNNGVDLDLYVGKNITSVGEQVIANAQTNGWDSFGFCPLYATNRKTYVGIVIYAAGSSVTFNCTDFQIEITFEKGAFVVESSVKGGYLPAVLANTITLDPIAINNMMVQYSVKSGTLYYKKTSESNYSSIAFTGDSVTIPANTLEEDEEYNIYFTAVADDDSTTTTEVYTVSTGDVVGTVTALTPSNTVAYGSPTFTWLYENEFGNKPTAYDLQVSLDQATWSDIASHVQSEDTFATVAVPIGGLMYWRVRSYNQVDVVSEWSNVLLFTNVLPPSPPTITSVTGKGRLTVSWNSANQIAYQVMIGEYDSGWIYSTDKSYFLNEYLSDGVYEIKVRVTNAIGLQSDWAVYSYSQTGSLPGPYATVTMREGYNEIAIDGTFDRYYIIRNGVVVAKTHETTYNDYFCNGSDRYVIRGVNSDDSFGDTILTGAYTCRKPAVITPEGQITYVNQRLDEAPQITSSNTLEVVRVEYLEREKPVYHIGQMHSRTWSVSCSANIQPGQVYFYRNFRGDKAWVICANIQSTLNFRGVHEYQYTLEELDYDEGISYAL